MAPRPPLIRRAAPADAAAFSALVERAYAPWIARIGRRPGPLDADHAAQVRAGTVWLREHDGLAGAIVLVPGDDHLLVENVAVDPARQGAGHGRELLAFAARRARAAGLPELRLYTHALMTENIALYRRLGWEEHERRAEEGFSRVFFRRPVLTGGERWVRAELARLREARFAPEAVGRFLVVSQRRANELRRAQPALGRQAWSWTGTGAAGWIGLGTAGVEPFRRRRAGGLAWWVACAVMLDWHLGMVETPAGAARPLSGADAITLARAWLVPVVWDDPRPLVLLAGTLSDGADGVLARRGEPTRIGRDLEGLVDACFAVAALAGARRRKRLGAAAVRAEVGRQALGFGSALWAYFVRLGPPDPRWTRTARALTPVRAAGLVAAGLGLRRTADALVLGGAGASVAVLAAEWRERRGAP